MTTARRIGPGAMRPPRCAAHAGPAAANCITTSRPTTAVARAPTKSQSSANAVLTTGDLPMTRLLSNLTAADTAAESPSEVLLPCRDLLIAARYFTPTEAHVVCGCIVAAGIPA